MPIYENFLPRSFSAGAPIGARSYLPEAVPWTEFEQAYIQKKAAPEPGVELPLIGRVPGLWRILQILSAGEYGVANALKSVVRSQYYEGEDDPFTAFWKGFRSAWTDERKYNVTFSDVLTELGWDPQTTSEKVAKGVVGFLGSVLIDPISYLGFGARGLKLGGETLKSVTESLSTRMGKKLTLPGRFARKGVNLSKTGQKVRKALFESLGPTADPLEMYAKEVQANRMMGKLIFPTDGMPTDLARELKGSLIDKALEAMGKEVNPATREWFVTKGYKKLVDVGGLRVGPLRLFAARGSFYNPSVTHLSGFTIGKALETGTPIHHAFAAGIIESRLWDEVVRKPLQAIFKPLADKFRRFKGASPEEKMILKSIFSAESRGKEEAETLLGSILLLPKGKGVEKLTVGGLEVQVPKEAIRRMNTNEMRLVGQILHRARKEGKIGDELEKWATEHLLKRSEIAQQWLKRTGLEKLPDTLVGPIVRAARLSQDLMESLAAREAERGMLDHFVDAYIPRMFKVLRKDLKDPQKLKATLLREGGHWDIFKLRQTKFGDWEEMYNLYKSGAEEGIGILEDRIDKLLGARLGAHFAQANFEDAVRNFYRVASKFPHRPGAEKTWLAKRELVGQIPQFAEKAALAQAHKVLPGLPRSAEKEFTDILIDLRKTTISTEMAEKNLERLVKWASRRRNLTPENIDRILDEVKSVVAEKVALATDPAQKSVATVLQAGLRSLRNALTSHSIAKTFQRAVENLKAEFGTPAPLHILSPKAKKVLEETTKGIPGGWEKLDREGLRQAVEKTLERYAGSLRPDDIPKIRRQAFRRVKSIESVKASAQEAQGTLQQLYKAGTPRAKNDLFVRTVRTGTETVRKIEGRLERIYGDIELISRKKYVNQADRVRLELAWQELEALQKIRRQVGALPFWENLGQRKRELEELVSDVRAINQLAKEKGVRESLPAVILSLSPGGIEGLEKGQRKTLIQWLKGGEFNERAADYLTARQSADEALKLIRRKDIKVKSFVTGHPVSLSSVVGGSKAMAKALEDMSLTRRKYLGGLTSFADRIEAGTSLLRKWFTGQLLPGLPILRPAFHFRNMIDLTIRNVMGNGLRSLFDPDTWVDTWKILHGKDGVLKGMPGMTYEAVRNLLRHSGQWSQKFGRFDFGESDKLFQRVKTAVQLKAPALAGFKADVAAYFERHPVFSRLGPRRIGVDMENFALTFNMVAGLRNGMTPLEALEHSQQFLFFYGNMTAFERNVMRTIIPFWSFQRQAISLIKWIAINKPRIFNYFPRIRDMAFPTTEEMAMMPDWVKDYPFVQIGEGPKGPRIISMRNVFSIDILPEILPKSWHDLLSQVNPLVTVPFELAFGRELYMLRDIKPVKLLWNKLQTKEARQLWSILHPREVTIGGKNYIAVDGPMYHAVTRLWFARFFRESDTAFSLLEGKLGRSGLAGLLTGFKLIELDRERQLNLLELDAARAYREYLRAVKSGDDRRAKQILDEMRLRW